ncbi:MULTISPECIES: TonB family protein [unclassified Lentimonas]|uniref:TonB family protein n=1 Tax=unclassified Lentimonas TaxID=2630993 RepID=UPI0013208DBC|nr:MULTISPECIES: TonB family protein [unclassified Lentimonas]CAA6679999.1 Unannotated [Lentimonas sp. CC4]CAA6686555.1 Unannotated [Lentimonas sp. CC6]CAA6690421.1 Unannotated [Lentimonas sp. CC19]CAA6693879.1 Unannotated [Lentimonas sp. CC10]CAA7068625.1 Unannotated [Lentimonas sp. CC11]
MARLYQPPKKGSNLAVSTVLGLVAALLIFLLIPLVQFSEVRPATAQPIEELVLAVPPPPPPPSDPPPPPPEEKEETPPELDTPPPMPSLEQLELSLNPGIGGELTIGDSLDFNFQVESAEQLMSRYGFDDLDEVPHVTRHGRIQYPVQLQRRRVEGYVQLLVFIDPSGRVDVQEVLNYSHKDFVAPAKAGAAATRFSPPIRNGQAVSAKYSWRIEFSLNR